MSFDAIIAAAVVVVAAILLLIGITVPTIVDAQQQLNNNPDQPQPLPTGNVTNSKYLTIKDQKYINQEFIDSITGTIINNSTQQISSATANAILYDKNNTIITLEFGLADVSTLNPGQESAFVINLFGSDKEPIDHYTLIPSGLPS